MAAHIQANCTKCGICEPICPTGSIKPGATRFVIDSDTCIDCLNCVPVCPVNAIRPPKSRAAAKQKNAG